MCYEREDIRTPPDSLDCQSSSSWSPFSYRYGNQFAQQSASASDLNSEDRDFEQFFEAFISHSPTMSALENQTTQSSLLEDPFQQSNDNVPFSSFNNENEAIIANNFQSTPPLCGIPYVPQNPQISTLHHKENALQRHRS